MVKLEEEKSSEKQLTRVITFLHHTNIIVISISQIVCFNNSGNNVTRFKTVTGSSTGIFRPLSKITDGREISETGSIIYRSKFTDGSDWILIDLSQDEEVISCKIYNVFDDCCRYRIFGAKLALLSSNSTEIAVVEIMSSQSLYIYLWGLVKEKKRDYCFFLSFFFFSVFVF